MKKVLCLLLAALLLAGCSVQPTAVTEPASVQTAPTSAPEPEQLVLAVYPASGQERVTAAAVRADRGVLLLERYDQTENATLRRLQFLDLAQGCLAQSVPLEDLPNEALYRMELTEDGKLRFFNPYEPEAALYNLDGTLDAQIANPAQSDEGFRFPHALTDRRFSTVPGCASYRCYCNGSDLFTAYAFADDPEALYLAEGGNDMICDVLRHCVLTAEYQSASKALCYRLLDLDQGALCHTLTLAPDAAPQLLESTFLTAIDAKLFEGGAMLITQQETYPPAAYAAGAYGEGEAEPDWQQRVCLWRFPAQAAQPFAVQRMDEAAFRAENERMAKAIEAQYEIGVLLDTAPADDRPPVMAGDDAQALTDAHVLLGCTCFATYELLRVLTRFLALLPSGFTHEMCRDFTDPTQSHTAFNIYIVREIPGQSAAYANGWNDELMICLATDEFSPQLLPHEFMHIIERRIHAEYASRGEDFWSQWNVLNPEGFFYDPADENLPYDYFVTTYAMLDSMEDRADTFAYLFDAQTPLNDCWWYKEHPHIQAKVALLIEALRKAYPSVQNADRVWWEKEP